MGQIDFSSSCDHINLYQTPFKMKIALVVLLATAAACLICEVSADPIPDAYPMAYPMAYPEPAADPRPQKCSSPCTCCIQYTCPNRMCAACVGSCQGQKPQ